MPVTPTDPRQYADLSGIKIVASDMDNTLVGTDGELPGEIWDIIRELKAEGIQFVPASGRQVATLQDMFAPVADGMTFISANGGLLARASERLYSARLKPEDLGDIMTIVRDLASGGTNVGAVLIGEKQSYVERTDTAFVSEVQRYFHQLQILEDALEADDHIVKVGIYSFDGLDPVLPRLESYQQTHSLTFSADDWVDVQGKNVNKGVALEELQRILGVGADETVVFGDYLNDSELMAAGTHSFAVANAHPDVIAAARYVAPSCAERGVVQVLQHILDRK